MPTFENITALIIEDDQTSINVLRKLLDQLLVKSVVITDSYNIESHLKTLQRPDIVFLDLEMPRVNGYTVLDLMGKTPKFSGVPIVAYTTHISHLNEAYAAGFHSFLGKPLDSRLFPDQLRRILEGEAVWEVE